MSDYLNAYFSEVRKTLEELTTRQRKPIEQAGEWVANSLAQGGVWAVYDTGHLLQHEAHIRAGGLIGMVPFRFEMQVDLPVLRNESSSAPTDTLEREVALALDRSGLRSRDVLLLNSNSGRTANVIELAIQARQRGVATIGLASSEQMAQCEAAHATGKKLDSVVDCFLDNASPHGDGLLEAGSGERMCPGSGIFSAVLLWAVQAHAVALLESRGLSPTIYRSVHVSGQEYIDRQIEAYKRQGF